MRTTKKLLDSLAGTINSLTNSPTEYSKGHFCISSAYGGYELQRVANDSGATVSISNGYFTPSVLERFMRGYISGLQFARQNAEGYI